MKTCQACKAENVDTAAFCKKCGTILKAGSKKCPNGHEMDPTWTTCKYCESMKLNAGGAPGGDAPPPVRPPTMDMPMPVGRKPTDDMSPFAIPGGRPPTEPWAGASIPPRPGPPAPPQKRRAQTDIMPTPGAQTGEAAPKSKIVGLLVTYTWKPEGQVFTIREGRNRIGGGEICEVSIPEDNHLSDFNTHIIYRPQGSRSFIINDNNSTNGTVIIGGGPEGSDLQVEENLRLSNYARIRVGKTLLTFIIIAGQDGGPPAHPGLDAVSRKEQ